MEIYLEFMNSNTALSTTSAVLVPIAVVYGCAKNGLELHRVMQISNAIDHVSIHSSAQLGVNRIPAGQRKNRHHGATDAINLAMWKSWVAHTISALSIFFD